MALFGFIINFSLGHLLNYKSAAARSLVFGIVVNFDYFGSTQDYLALLGLLSRQMLLLRTQLLQILRLSRRGISLSELLL